MNASRPVHHDSPRLSAVQAQAAAAAFLAQPGAARNPFSTSGRLVWQGTTYHCKHGQRCLAAEADALAHASALPNEHGVHVVPFAGYDAASNVLFTHHVAGVSLFNALWNSTDPWRPWARSPREWTELCSATGGWLRRLHDRPCALRSDVTSDALRANLLATILDRLRTVREHPLGLTEAGASPALLDRLADHAAALAGDAAWQAQPTAAIHADLTPGNMLLGPTGELTVLDFGYTRPGFAIEDVARLWCSLWEIAATGRTRAHHLRPAMTALLQAYGLPAAAVDAAPFRLLRIWNGVTRLNEAVSTRPRYRPATARLHRKLTRHHLRWLCDEAAADNARCAA